MQSSQQLVSSFSAEVSLRLTLPDLRAPQSERLNDFAIVLNSAIQFLSELHSRSEAFRDYANTSNYVQELLFVLYPLSCFQEGQP
jgi:hypothetical protein